RQPRLPRPGRTGRRVQEPQHCRPSPRRNRTHGGPGPQVLLAAQHVPLRLHPLPLPHPQPHLRHDPRRPAPRGGGQAVPRRQGRRQERRGPRQGRQHRRDQQPEEGAREEGPRHRGAEEAEPGPHRRVQPSRRPGQPGRWHAEEGSV
ncbi:hypothetical protein LTR28_004538, partial [Elasticomyces elasticus]